MQQGTEEHKIDELIALLNHPHYLRCRFDERQNKFTFGSSFSCGGLLKRLKRQFFPRYEYRRNKTEAPYWRRGATSSTAIGSLVDREVESLVNVRGIRSIRDPDFPGSVTVKTRRFFERLDELSIVPVFAEFPVVSTEKGVGTRIDVVGIRNLGAPNECIVTIERKTGYTAGMYKAQGVMEAPLERVKNNAFNQHQLQSLVGAMLLERCYGVTVSERYVLYTDWKKDYWRPLPAYLRQPRGLALKIWTHL